MLRLLFISLLLLSSCVSNHRAPAISKGEKYYGKEEEKKQIEDEILESITDSK